MNVYDFDNTIYNGESMVDFYFFILRYHPEFISLLPKMIYMLTRYKLCMISEEELFSEAEKYTEFILKKLDLDKLVPLFWDKYQKKIKRFYIKNMKADDVILSANADFLIEEICKRLGVKNFLTSCFDRSSGRIIKLCFRENKVKIFKDAFPENDIDCFFTDSMNDKPMFELANKIYIVKGNNVKELIYDK